MGVEFAGLPHWEFTIVENSGDHYTVSATRDGGIRGEGKGPDLDELFEDLQEWAHGIDRDLEARGSES